MASPSNASEPESSEEEEIIEAGFDPLLFWDQYRQVILLAGGVILLGLVGFGIYEYNHSQRIAAAGAALAQASSEDDYRQIVDKYAGTVAAGDASLMLASELRHDKKYDEAIEILQTFLDKYPAHPLVSGAELSIGETLEAQGKTDDAIAKYQEVAAKYSDTYSAPIAVIAQANILKAQGKIEDAQRLYENFRAQFPDSVFTQEAMMEMRLLRPAPGSAPSANSEIPSLLNAAPAASASPAASTPAPIVPALPGASPH